jgi:large conductance mechanosensitive channel
VFFLVVKPLNVLQERRRRGQEPPPEELSDEAALLTEIRDLLRAQSAGAGSTARPASPPFRGPSDDPPSSTGW